MEEKYFYHNYDKRMGGDYCQIFDENLNLIRTIKNVSEVQGLQQITKRTDIVSALLITEPLNDEFSIVKGHYEMTDGQRKNVIRNIIG